MLRINYIPNFKAGQPFVVVTGTKESFLRAAGFFRQKPGGFLCDRAVTELCNIQPLADEALYLTADECADIAVHFDQVVSTGEPCHAYMDTTALKDVELLISYREYDPNLGRYLPKK